MTKKDFIALADRLKGLDVPEPVLQELIRFCRDRNPRFNASRWRGYLAGECGPNGGEIRKRRLVLADPVVELPQPALESADPNARLD